MFLQSTHPLQSRNQTQIILFSAHDNHFRPTTLSPPSPLSLRFPQFQSSCTLFIPNLFPNISLFAMCQSSWISSQTKRSTSKGGYSFLCNNSYLPQKHSTLNQLYTHHTGILILLPIVWPPPLLICASGPHLDENCPAIYHATTKITPHLSIYPTHHNHQQINPRPLFIPQPNLQNHPFRHLFPKAIDTNLHHNSQSHRQNLISIFIWPTYLSFLLDNLNSSQDFSFDLLPDHFWPPLRVSIFLDIP